MNYDDVHEPWKGFKMFDLLLHESQHLQTLMEDISCLISVYDANGQISPGILSGNVNIYGDFQECLSVGDDEELSFRGKHCFAEVQPFVAKSAIYLNFLRKLAQSYDLMQSRFEDVSSSQLTMSLPLLQSK